MKSEEKGGKVQLKKKTQTKLDWGWIPETTDVDWYSGITRNIQQIAGD